ncbi:substrate-binding domain-containing protein [Glaciecola sp. SC05]|uniref:substrate-binding domain-containing protein n=1 Tax=Glaciecola sp. SC05 TaxID=1987355 RepID=UPI003527D16E
MIAVKLSDQRTNNFLDPVSNLVLQGISQILEEADYSILLLPPYFKLQHIEGLKSFVEGFVFCGPPSRDCLDELAHQRKAIVAIDFTIDKGVSININNRQAAKACAQVGFSHNPDATSVLGLKLSQQNENTSLDNTTLSDSPENVMVERLKGYEEAALDNNLLIHKQNIWNIPENTHFYAYETAKYVLQQPSRPELLLCMSDQIALSAIQAAKDLGLSVPADVLITGFDGIFDAQRSRPTLTTIEQPSILKGRAAAEALFGRRREHKIVMHAPLIIGESCPLKNKGNS